MKIAVGFPDPLHIGIQPVIVHNLKISLLDLKKGILRRGNFFRAHSINEYITIDEPVETTKVFIGLIVELCA